MIDAELDFTSTLYLETTLLAVILLANTPMFNTKSKCYKRYTFLTDKL